MAINKDRNLIKRGSVWYFRKKISGSSIKISLKTSSVSVARKIRNEYLYNINIYGSIHKTEKRKAPEFGELAVRWFKLNKNKLKKSTRRDYRNSLNNFILPKFRNIPIDQIEYLDIETFNSELKCKNKRLINLLIPMRNVFRFAHKNDYIDKNPMDLLDPIEPEKPDINPLSMREVLAIIDNVDRHYKNFFTFAFYTGMRFGEMSALKWKKVDFKLGIIKVRETRVQGEEGKPKTKGSIRDVKMFPMVVEALRDQRKATFGKSEYVFLNIYGRPLISNAINRYPWKKVLKKLGIKYRPSQQTRHTYITMMLDNGEHMGWVARQVGHNSPKMIFERYYSYIQNYQSDDGQKFMSKLNDITMQGCNKVVPKLSHLKKKELA